LGIGVVAKGGNARTVLTIMFFPFRVRGMVLSASFSLTDWAGIVLPGAIWAVLRMAVATECAACAAPAITDVILTWNYLGYGGNGGSNAEL